MKRFTTTLIISAIGLGSQLANAAPPGDVPSAVVHFADLNLSHSEGIAVLYRRLKAAAETVCALQDGRDLGSQARYKLCWRSALGAAVAKVDHPALTAYFQAKSGGGNAAFQIAQN